MKCICMKCKLMVTLSGIEEKLYRTYKEGGERLSHMECGGALLNIIHQENVQLVDGRTLSIFLNRETSMLTVDVVREDGEAGNEVVRMNLDKVDTSREF